MSEPKHSSQVSPQSRRKLSEARTARERLPVVWIVLAGTIGLVFVVVLALAALL